MDLVITQQDSLSDECPATAGISYFFVQGCDDYEHDGFADSIDGCDTSKGRSVFDRYGCPDYDEDGWSNNDGTGDLETASNRIGSKPKTRMDGARQLRC